MAVIGSRFRRLLAVSVPAAAAAILVAAVVTELWVRHVWDERQGRPGFFLSDPVRGQRLNEGYSGWFAGVPVHINRFGLRDPREYDLAKKPNTFRILVLGDSVTFGHGSVYEHTYPYLVEQRLQAWRPDIDWQVWNAAVPGYNTSQELAQLLEVGPRFRPDLVIVGFFENDLIDNEELVAPGVLKTAVFRALSTARRHLYSLELYKKLYLQLASKLAPSDAYRRRVEHLGTEESLLSKAADATTIKEQALTPFDHLSSEQIRDVRCVYGMKPNPAVIPAMKHERTYPVWLDAVRAFQRLHQSGEYRIVFFLNVVPPICPDGDVFYDGGSKAINAFYLSIMGDGTPAVSCYDAFLHVRPSQMPSAQGHALGNSNVVKADVLFGYLHDSLLPGALSGALHARRTP